LDIVQKIWDPLR